MLAAEHYPDSLLRLRRLNHELLEIHRSKISLHHAKAGYDYPTIRLPHTFSRLAGLSTRMYQTIQEGALAFLTVVSPTENASKTPKASVFTRRRSGVRIAPAPIVLFANRHARAALLRSPRRRLCYDQARSNRSRFMTLFHTATKSCRNFSWESSHP